MLLTLQRRGGIWKKTFSALIYLTASLTAANWLGWYHMLQEDNSRGLPALAKLAVGGCVIFAAGCLLSLFNSRFGIILGGIAACMSWPYFGFLAAYLPWRDFVWLVKSDVGGWAKVTAVFGLLPATIWSLLQLLPALGPPTDG